ncbi:MAG: hypothetical protein K0R40_1030 [Burkholderiales bacterium]|jgi:hypothetical protein|nr:hypothetical protein [Burkholderiales bacterium]
MEELVILKVLGEGALPEGIGAFVEVETSEGVRQIRFTLQDAEKLVAALHVALKQVQQARARAGLPPLPERPRTPEHWETSLDPVQQVAVLRAHFPDYTLEAEITRPDLPRIARFLDEALKRFEAGGEMRQ